MKRSEYCRILMQMEQANELRMSADTQREARVYRRDYNRMAKSIRPYTTGQKKFDPE